MPQVSREAKNNRNLNHGLSCSSRTHPGPPSCLYFTLPVKTCVISPAGLWGLEFIPLSQLPERTQLGAGLRGSSAPAQNGCQELAGMSG